ncbi:TolB family protein [Ekhidna sp. To15]|uniref:TolB family protein n=1 Tax=Ekhidna sp. To15 TaxID=3395267 RepID=UPI003F5218AE
MLKYIIGLILIGSFISCKKTDKKTESLLYLSVRDKDYNIFLNDLDGNEKQLTNNPGFDYAPMWNEILGSVIYYSYENDSFLIANMDLSGQPISLETYGQQEFNLSPDGKKLVSQVNIGDFSALILANIDGSSQDTISDTKSYNGRAKWSWQSNQIAYISDREGNNEVYLYHLEDRSTRRLTNNDEVEKYLTWSPDGNKLAYTTQYYEEGKPDRNDVFVLNLKSGKSSQITSNDYNDTELAWSPISDRIAFHSTRDGEDHIFVMNSDGSNVEQITRVSAYHGEPCWAWE